MPTKKKRLKRKKPAAKTSSYPTPLFSVPASLVSVNKAPTTQITPPYEYPPVDQSVPYARTPVNISGSWTETYTGSKTVTTTVDTVTQASILLNYNLAATLTSGTVTGFQRFRLEIVRGSTIIFTVSLALSAVPSSDSIASNAEIVLQPGDVIQIVSRPQNATSLLYYCFASVMLQPYR